MDLQEHSGSSSGSSMAAAAAAWQQQQAQHHTGDGGCYNINRSSKLEVVNAGSCTSRD
jgi:hypothetical protein